MNTELKPTEDQLDTIGRTPGLIGDKLIEPQKGKVHEINPINSFKKWLLNKLVPYIEGTHKKDNKTLEANRTY